MHHNTYLKYIRLALNIVKIYSIHSSRVYGVSVVRCMSFPLQEKNPVY